MSSSSSSKNTATATSHRSNQRLFGQVAACLGSAAASKTPCSFGPESASSERQ